MVFPFESQTEVKRVIYIGACSVFGNSDGDFLAKRLLKKSKCEAVIGYTENAGWYNSNFTEMLFISRFYNSPNPFYELEEIYNSVVNDFAPARRIGLKMFSRKSIGN
jgi:proline dehydrogenase